MKKNTKIKKVFNVALLLFSLFIPTFVFAGPFDYKLLEAFPGFYAANTTMNNMPEFILAIYKFGIWTVGIAGLLMLTVGGFMYMSSAGNTSVASKAKGVIEDAIIGIIAAMCAYLILYVINPDLTDIRISFTPVTIDSSSSSGTSGGTGGTKDNGTAKPGTSHNEVIKAAQSMMNKGCIYDQSRRNGCNGNPGYTDCSNLVCTSYKQAGCTCPGNVSGDYGSKAQAIGNSKDLKAGDVLWVPGHVVMCESDGCSQVIGAAGVGKNIKYSNGSYYINKGAKVVKAADYCKS
jgi:hypothetical protein